VTVTKEVLGEPVTVNWPTRVPVAGCSVQDAELTGGVGVTEPELQISPNPKPAPANNTVTPTAAELGDRVICGITVIVNMAVSPDDP
jgi:hypothetical protein